MILMGMVSPISVHDFGGTPLLGVPTYLSNNTTHTNIIKTVMTTLIIFFIAIIYLLKTEYHKA